jgi:beta-lactam-binding protein with PASTA domain
MGLQERIRWFGRLVLLAFILCSAAFLSAITAMRFAIQGREVDMPDLIGKRAGEAQVALEAKGLGFAIADHVYNSLPVDTVVRQSPPAGMRVKVSQRAHVVVSLGPQRVSIPSLTDKSLRAARLQLLSSGLQMGEVSEVYLPDAPAESVLEQDTLPGNTGATSPHVSLLVALGPRPPVFVMPELVGRPFPEAQRLLSAAGLHLAKITIQPATGTERQIVTAQTPPRGARVDGATAIEIQVAE